VSTTGVHKSEKKGVCGQPAVEARVRAHDGSRGMVDGRWGALAEQGGAGSGFPPPPALPARTGRCCPCVGKSTSKQDGKKGGGSGGGGGGGETGLA
jgi:hypothetical protein